jgi:hypothetical protein
LFLDDNAFEGELQQEAAVQCNIVMLWLIPVMSDQNKYTRTTGGASGRRAAMGKYNELTGNEFLMLMVACGTAYVLAGSWSRYCNARNIAPST